MTSVDERIAQVIAAAKSKGLAVGDGRPKSTKRIAVPQNSLRKTPAKKTTKREQATWRKLPKAWRRVREQNPDAKEWEIREKMDRVKELEARIAAGLIAVALGDQWQRAYQEWDRINLVHSSGCRLRFSKAWNGDRYGIMPVDCHQTRSDPLPTSITVDAGRSPASIARDIENRLISRGLLEKHQAFKDARQSKRREETEERLSVLKLAKVMGKHQLAIERSWRDHRPTTQDTCLANGCVSAVVNRTYSGHFRFDIVTTRPEIAEKIAIFMRSL